MTSGFLRFSNMAQILHSEVRNATEVKNMLAQNHHASFFLAVTLVCISACIPVQTMPPPAEPYSPTRHLLLQIPDWLDVISVDFAAAAWETDNSLMGSRGFYNVFGKHRQSGIHFLLIYEGFPERTDPIEIIEISPTQASADSVPANSP